MTSLYPRPRAVIHFCVDGTYPTLAAKAPSDPPRDGEEDRPNGGGGSPPCAALEENPPQHPAPDPPPAPGSSEAKLTRRDNSAEEQEEPAPAEPEPHELVVAWMNEHWDLVEAMARAGQAPQRPAPAPPDAGSTEAPPPPPIIHVRKGDRWNKPKMAEFLRQLAATHSVSAAARSVGMSRNSAYKLRSRLKGQPFDIAWEAAFRHGYDDLAHAALELALEGEEVPHYYQGELKGTHRKRNPQLIMGLLRMRNRAGAPMLGRYGAAAEFWSERWEQMIHRIETGAVTWDDEKSALGEQEMVRLELPDETRELDRIIARNRPDEPRGFGKP